MSALRPGAFPGALLSIVFVLAGFAGTADAYASTPVVIRQTASHASIHCYTLCRSRVPVCLRIHVPEP